MDSPALAPVPRRGAPQLPLQLGSPASSPALTPPIRIATATPPIRIASATPPIPIAPSPQTTIDSMKKSILKERSPKKRKTHMHCYRCGCRGKVQKYVTAMGKSKIIAPHCACSRCNGVSHCVFSNIDQCIVCGEKYEYDDIEHLYCCPSNCSDPNVSLYAKRFLSLRTVDVNTPLPPWKRTLLHSAVAAGDAHLCWHLLKKGANPFACDYLGISPIALATSMLPVVDESNCLADKSYHSAILIYRILPKINSEAFEYIEHLCPPKRMDRGFSMGDYHSGPSTALSSSFSSPLRHHSGSYGESTLFSHETEKQNTETTTHRRSRRRQRASTLHDSELEKKPVRRRRHKHRTGSTWADVVMRAGKRKDPVHSYLTAAPNMLTLPSHKEPAQYSDAVRHWTDAVKEEGKTHALLDSGLQKFTPLTLMRLVDTSIDTFTAPLGSSGPDQLDSEIIAGSSVTSGGVLSGGGMFVIEEDEGAAVNEKESAYTYDTPGTSPARRVRGTSQDYHMGSPLRERSFSQTSIGSPAGRSRSRTLSFSEPFVGRRRTYSEAEQGGARSLLMHCTLHELKRAVLDNDAVHASTTDDINLSNLSTEVDTGDADLLFSCNACLDLLKPSEFAFTCHRMGCNGNLCRDCLYRSLVVSVSSALYAVPLVRCPGKCRGR